MTEKVLRLYNDGELEILYFGTPQVNSTNADDLEKELNLLCDSCKLHETSTTLFID